MLIGNKQYIIKVEKYKNHRNKKEKVIHICGKYDVETYSSFYFGPYLLCLDLILYKQHFGVNLILFDDGLVNKIELTKDEQIDSILEFMGIVNMFGFADKNLDLKDTINKIINNYLFDIQDE